MIDWLASLVAPLNNVLFTIGSDHVSWAELLGFVTGGLCVWLTARGRISNFPLGILNSAFFFILFVSARLWADAVLQVVYIVLGFVGWWQWLYGGSRHASLRMKHATRRMMLGCIGFVIICTPFLTALLTSTHDSAPFWDALTTAMSLAAQWLLNAKLVETWFFWIAADIVYIPLYVSKNLVLTAGVYVLFLGMCISGLVTWRSESTSEERALERSDLAPSAI